MEIVDCIGSELLSPPIARGEASAFESFQLDSAVGCESDLVSLSFECSQPSFTPSYDDFYSDENASTPENTSRSNASLNGTTIEESTTISNQTGRLSRCPVCGKTYSVNKNLRLHIRVAHREDYSEWLSRYGANTCKQPESIVTDSIVIEDDHCKEDAITYTYSMKAPDEEKGRVQIVGSWTEEVEAPVSGGAATKEEGASYVCFKCCQVFTDRITIQRHILENHSDKKKYFCSICKIVFQRGDTYFKHRKRKHGNLSSVRCNLCNKYFFSYIGVKTHKLRIHQSSEATKRNSSIMKKYSSINKKRSTEKYPRKTKKRSTKTEKHYSENRTFSPNFKRCSSETKRRFTESKVHTTKTNLCSLNVKKVPDYETRSPGTKKLCLETKKPSPNTKKLSPDTKKLSPDTKKLSPDTKKLSPDTKKLSPDTKKLSPDTKKLSPDTKNLSPDSKKLSPNTKKLSPNTKKRSVDAKKLCSNIKASSDYVCKVCRTTYSCRKYYMRHIRRKHSDDAPFPCNMCSRRTHTLLALQCHKREVHGLVTKLKLNDAGVASESLAKMYKCSNCKAKFGRRKDLVKHRMVFHGVSSSEDKVGVISSNHGQLNPTSKESSKGSDSIPLGNFCCTKCGLKYTLRKSLNRHIRQKHRNE